MEIEYDLAQLAENLAKELPEIDALYLFGSRARGTKSTRSDADVLVVSSEYIQPKALRRFSAENCNALDLFTVDGGKAVSSQNESFIEAPSLADLLDLLGAVKLWSRKSGREAASIEWRFRVKEDVEFKPSNLPSSPTGLEKSDEGPFDPAKLTIGAIVSRLTVPQIVSVIGVSFVLLGGAFIAGREFEQLSSRDVDVIQDAPAIVRPGTD